MKLGFWTLGMPDWPNAEVARRAADLGYRGVDLRCARRDGQPSEGFNLSLESSKQENDQTRAAFDQAGVEISSVLCYNTPVYRDGEPHWSDFQGDVLLHARLAAEVGAPAIRVVIDAPPASDMWDTHLTQAWQAMARALDQVQGVKAVVENHPGRASAGQLLGAAERAGDPRIGVEFSPEHSLVMQENILELIDHYPDYIFQICLADRRVVQDGLADFDGRYYYVRYESVAVGSGMLPVAKMLERLGDKGFNGYISLKWEKSSTFGQHLPSGEIALRDYMSTMRKYSEYWE